MKVGKVRGCMHHVPQGLGLLLKPGCLPLEQSMCYLLGFALCQHTASRPTTGPWTGPQPRCRPSTCLPGGRAARVRAKRSLSWCPRSKIGPSAWTSAEASKSALGDTSSLSRASFCSVCFWSLDLASRAGSAPVTFAGEVALQQAWHAHVALEAVIQPAYSC